jgi:hypothetical protein
LTVRAIARQRFPIKRQGLRPSAWPEEIPGLGRRRIAPFERCARCLPSVHCALAGTFVRYGDTPLCLRHALAVRDAATRGLEERL